MDEINLLKLKLKVIELERTVLLQQNFVDVRRCGRCGSNQEALPKIMRNPTIFQKRSSAESYLKNMASATNDILVQVGILGANGYYLNWRVDSPETIARESVKYNHTVYKLFQRSSRAYLIMDLETYFEMSESNRDDFANGIMIIVKELLVFVKLTLPELCISLDDFAIEDSTSICSTGIGKYSAHIICRRIVFRSLEDDHFSFMFYFLNWFLERDNPLFPQWMRVKHNKLRRDPNGENDVLMEYAQVFAESGKNPWQNTCVDTCIYTRNRVFRVCGTSKQDGRMLRPSMLTKYWSNLGVETDATVANRIRWIETSLRCNDDHACSSIYILQPAGTYFSLLILKGDTFKLKN